MYLLEDVSYRGMKVEEMEDMTGIEVMTGIEDMTGMEVMTGTKNDVRKHLYKTGYMRLNGVWIKEATK